MSEISWIDLLCVVGVGSLNYILFFLGFIGGVFFVGVLNDWVYIWFKCCNNGVGCLEYCVFMMVIGMVLIFIGLFWWGWLGEVKLYWIMFNIGSFLFVVGMYNCSVCVVVYMIDMYM